MITAFLLLQCKELKNLQENFSDFKTSRETFEILNLCLNIELCLFFTLLLKSVSKPIYQLLFYVTDKMKLQKFVTKQVSKFQFDYKESKK